LCLVVITISALEQNVVAGNSASFTKLHRMKLASFENPASEKLTPLKVVAKKLHLPKNIADSKLTMENVAE
jgi:hypothetical protein